MTPTPQSEVLTGSEGALPEGQVVISGMSGLYPKSRYVRDLENILYNKINPITSDNSRWKSNHPEVASYFGHAPDLERFDAQFFKVHHRLGNSMDSMARKLLEVAYEAIYDAGVSPQDFYGKKVGVFVGSCFSESDKSFCYASSNGFGIAGCCKAMFANRISYWLNAKGPSMSIDDACCSSTAALEQAYQAMKRGECEAALVGGAHLCLHPETSIHHGRLMRQSQTGETKSFDQNAAGCTKSEAVNMLFLQRAEDAFRVYAKIMHVKCEYTKLSEGKTGPKFGFYRCPDYTANFLKSFYDEAGVPPNVVEYVEAFGSAVAEADKSELEALDKVFCKNRKEPLMVGSVMSNIGYGDAASGISAITKVLLGFHRGELAANLNYETPRTDVAALAEGRIQVLSDHQHFRRTYAAINNMSVTGINGHVLLHGHYKQKDLNRYKTSIPHLVTISGRQETSVARIFKELKSHPIDPEELALLQNVHKTRIHGHLGRGYIILDTKDDNTISLSEKTDYFDNAERPLWFVYSGMGSQWPGMGIELMRMPIFAAAIERCRQALEPKGIDIIHIITSPEKTIFDNILHSFVGIAAVQIGLTDVLRELGLVADKIIGHSVGELGCAYADGCLTAEEMILSAYSRGMVSLETPFIRGSMAAVGIGFQQAKKLCPPEIEVACHNSSESCTISGPAEVMKLFVSELIAKGIFAKEVPCSNIAYHSQYIAKAGPGLLKYLKEVIPKPRLRSDRWVSTSVPQEKWEDLSAKYSSAEYHTNNLLSPVLFEETSSLIPSNAVLVEIAPHGLLQAILKRSLPESCTNIPLTRRGHPDSPRMVLEAVGKLYMEGYNPKVQVLYPKVEFPVSTHTPFLSHLVDWAHHEKWALPYYVSAQRSEAASRKVLVSVHDEEHQYLKGHVIRKTVCLPYSFALVAVWDTLAMTLKVPKKELDVVFNDVIFHAHPVLHDQKVVKVEVSLHRGSGRFEIMDGNFKIATGFISSDKKLILKSELRNVTDTDLTLSSSQVYQLFFEREHEYNGEFRSIQSVNNTLTESYILWNDNWVTLIDGMVQLNALKRSHNAVSQLSHISKMTIDVKEHLKHVFTEKDGKAMIKAQVCDINDVTWCGGILMEHMRFNDMPPSKELVELKTLRFVPRFQSNINKTTALEILIQIVAENLEKRVVYIVGIASRHEDHSLIEELFEERVFAINIPGIKVEYREVNVAAMTQFCEKYINKADVVIVQNLSNRFEVAKILNRWCRNNSFVINTDCLTSSTETSATLNIVSAITNKDFRLELIRFKSTPLVVPPITVTISSERDLSNLIAARNALSGQSSLIVLSPYPSFPGLMSLIQNWRQDTSRNNINLIMINDAMDTRKLSQLPTNLAYNIIDSGIWGGEYYLPSEVKIRHSKSIALQGEVRGNFDTLKWVDAPTMSKSGILVKVHYAGINMHDVLRASGAIQTNNDVCSGYGMDFSGMTKNGERVMGLVSNSAAQSEVIAQPELLWPVPAHWDLEDAATVPLAYVYAYYCLDLRISVNTGLPIRSILVHGGAGALGQAIISISLAKGYRVFATVNDAQKKIFLLRIFPELREENIGYSRDSSFADMIMGATKSKGCDIVICGLKGELKNASLKCCSNFGMTFDTVQIQSHEKFNFGMDFLSLDRTYRPIDITSIFNSPKKDELKRLQLLVTEGIALGHVRPLSRVTFAPEEVSRAFRLLAASRHRGRALLRLEGQHSPAQPRLINSGDGCHIIFCESQPLGLQLADMLICSGAKKIHLHYEHPPSDLCLRQRFWNQNDVKVSISSELLTDNTSFSKFLENVMTSGPIDGVYLAAGHILKKPVLSTLDLVVRKLCPSLKHFLVFSNGDDFGKFVALERAKDSLPATVVNFSLLDSFMDEDDLIWCRGLKEAAESALLSANSVHMAQNKPPSQDSLIQQISGLCDSSFPKDVSDRTALENLGLQPDKKQFISSFLRTWHISIDETDVQNLSVQRIREIEKRMTDTKFDDAKGLRNFFSYVDPDEMLATVEMVPLPTLTSSSCTRDHEFDVNETYMCVVPGLEGHHERFRSLCERLKLPAIVLQPGLDHLHETVEQLALRYSKVIQKKTGIKSNFNLLGFGSGVLVALEVAAILEQQGQTGIVFCIGEGPEEIKELIKEELDEYSTEEALQIGIVQHMYTLMTGEQAPMELIVGSTWRQRVDACVRTLLGHVSHSAQYVRGLIEVAYARLAATLSYDAEPKALKSKIIVLRPKSTLTASSAPCTLQRYSRQPITIHNISASLAHAAKDIHCASLINKYLPKDILDEFEKRNLCETYLMNADKFII